MQVTRRQWGKGALAGAGVVMLGSGLGGCGVIGGAKGRTLIFGQSMEPTGLNSAISTAAPATFTATKLFDPLVGYDAHGRPTPKLAHAWEVSEDGLTYTFHLRPGLRWHDGTPLLADDVGYSLSEVWKKYHARGRTTFANVVAFSSPDPLTSVWHLSQPAPYLLNCLAVTEATVIPRHLYQGSDILTNPANVAPVGSGPFRFKSWDRGNRIDLVRNPDYWDKGAPGIDGIAVRFLPDVTALAIALESGSIDLAEQIPFSQVARLRKHPGLQILEVTNPLSPNWTQLEFNLDKAPFNDVRVRQAFIHAIDRAFIAGAIYGDAAVADSPIPAELADFHAKGLPQYALDYDKAGQLLDAAGLKSDASGVRLRATLDFATSGVNIRVASSLRSTLGRVGIVVQARPQDQGEYINRIYTRHDFDLSMTGSGAGRDPAIGVQRYYWSKNIKPGVAFSNGAHYRNPEVDQLLEAAQVELNVERRRALYARFQQIVMQDLPYIPLVWSRGYVGASTRVGNLDQELGGVNTDFSHLTLKG